MELEVEERVAIALHPPRCPKCGAGVDCLEYTGLETVKATYTLTEFIGWEMEGVMGSEEFLCPECTALLFNDEEDARKFLMGLDEEPVLEDYNGEREGCTAGSRSITSAEMPTMWGGIRISGLLCIRACEVPAHHRERRARLGCYGTTGWHLAGLNRVSMPRMWNSDVSQR